ncbi:UDP-glycosyltransferase 74E2-like [Cucurbita maxima]|uniref:Glycosyltransferase n=1 Tax=Cucurbita maxima TaxID=3661 RepID=A0A6J1KMH5_CUCMA|nr:UDP-glycosyltransferase 74E2-like [Cucurbita maxima]
MSNTTANGGRRLSHVVLFAYPKQGHLSPMLQFAKRLASKGLRITFLTTTSATKSLEIDLPASYQIDLRFISDVRTEPIRSLKDEHESFEAVVSKSFGDFIDRTLRSSGYDPPRFVVFDSVMPWAMDVARVRGIDSAPLFTESCVVNHILNQVYEGSFSIPPVENVAAGISIPPLPVLQTEDLPYFSYEPELVLKFMTDQFSSFKNAKWIFFNTFDQLEMKVVNWMAQKWPIKTIGPSIPSAYLDGRLKDDKTYGLNHQNLNHGKIFQWLYSKEIASVIYISFGSLVILPEEQVKEVANFLKDTNFSFLWVLRESEQEKLPNNFMQQTSHKGLVVKWCCQLQVLSHKSICCFITHCGWNSTIEALSLGVPMIAVPQWIDQTTNAKFVADVWKVGARVKMNDKGIATKLELEASLRHVSQGYRQNEIKQNSIKLRNLAKEAMEEGGSSDINIERFVKEFDPF